MATTDLRPLLEARRARWLEHLAENRKLAADALRAIAVDEAHLQELEFTLEQLPAAEAPPSAAPAPEAAPPAPEKFPREKCAALIIEDYEGHPLPENIDGLTPIYAERWNTRTLRSGLELAKQRRQKVDPIPDGDLKVDPLAIPGFLDRRQEEAAE